MPSRHTKIQGRSLHMSTLNTNSLNTMCFLHTCLFIPSTPSTCISHITYSIPSFVRFDHVSQLQDSSNDLYRTRTGSFTPPLFWHLIRQTPEMTSPDKWFLRDLCHIIGGARPPPSPSLGPPGTLPMRVGPIGNTSHNPLYRFPENNPATAHKHPQKLNFSTMDI